MPDKEYRVHLARVDKTVVEGEVAEVRLTLLNKESMVHITEGEQFYTLLLPVEVDPWENDA